MNERGGLSRLNLVLLLVLALLAVLNWQLGRSGNQRGLDFMPEMVRSLAAESFSANPVLAQGMTLQQPPEGTIPRGLLPLHLVPTPEDALRAGVELQNPFSADDAPSVSRGQVIYSRYCALCHGQTGQGDGTVAQRGFPAPPSLLAPNARGLLDGQIFHIITVGQGNMPAYAAQLDREDRWKAVLHVRELQNKGELDAATVQEGDAASADASTSGENGAVP